MAKNLPVLNISTISLSVISVITVIIILLIAGCTSKSASSPGDSSDSSSDSPVKEKPANVQSQGQKSDKSSSSSNSSSSSSPSSSGSQLTGQAVQIVQHTTNNADSSSTKNNSANDSANSNKEDTANIVKNATIRILFAAAKLPKDIDEFEIFVQSAEVLSFDKKITYSTYSTKSSALELAGLADSGGVKRAYVFTVQPGLYKELNLNITDVRVLDKGTVKNPAIPNNMIYIPLSLNVRPGKNYSILVEFDIDKSLNRTIGAVSGAEQSAGESLKFLPKVFTLEFDNAIAAKYLKPEQYEAESSLAVDSSQSSQITAQLPSSSELSGSSGLGQISGAAVAQPGQASQAGQTGTNANQTAAANQTTNQSANQSALNQSNPAQQPQQPSSGAAGSAGSSAGSSSDASSANNQTNNQGTNNQNVKTPGQFFDLSKIAQYKYRIITTISSQIIEVTSNVYVSSDTFNGTVVWKLVSNVSAEPAQTITETYVEKSTGLCVFSSSKIIAFGSIVSAESGCPEEGAFTASSSTDILKPDAEEKVIVPAGEFNAKVYSSSKSTYWVADNTPLPVQYSYPVPAGSVKYQLVSYTPV